MRHLWNGRCDLRRLKELRISEEFGKLCSIVSMQTTAVRKTSIGLLFLIIAFYRSHNLIPGELFKARKWLYIGLTVETIIEM